MTTTDTQTPEPWLPRIGITYYGNRYDARVIKASGRTLQVEFATITDLRDNTTRTRTVRLGKHWKPSRWQLDEIARRVGCFEDYSDLLNAAGNYRPTIYPETFKGNEVFARALCCRYDLDQRKRDDPRRVFPERDYSDLDPLRDWYS